jgi:ribosomal protein L37AE/L43A
MNPRGEIPLSVPKRCPVCNKKKGIQSHSLSIWCMNCGWGKNRYRDPSTGGYTERRPMR